MFDNLRPPELTRVQVLNETGEVDPFVVTSALIKLPAGYHEVTLTWFQNSGLSELDWESVRG